MTFLYISSIVFKKCVFKEKWLLRRISGRDLQRKNPTTGQFQPVVFLAILKLFAKIIIFWLPDEAHKQPNIRAKNKL
jgi:hypothetical protein